MSKHALSVLGIGLLLIGCGSGDPTDGEGGSSGNKPGSEQPGSQEPGKNPDGSPTDPNNPGGGTGPAVPSTIPRKGSVDVTLRADNGAANNAIVSFGLPFPQGILTSEKHVTLKDKTGKPVAISATVLAKWPADGSIRSVLVAFKTTLAANATETWKAEWGDPTTSPDAGTLAPNPNGPVAATLPADHYAKSFVSGILLSAAANQRFSDYDAELSRSYATINFNASTVQCSGSAARTYYDGPHARYQRFFRTGNAQTLRAARSEAIWFRQNELTFYQGRKLAVHKCQPAGWTPSVPLDWGVLRQMYSQGMLDDYLVTGDPAAKEAVLAMGEAYLQNIPTLTKQNPPILEITERNLGWTLIGMAQYYALDSRAEVKDATKALVDRAIAWQGRGTSGGLEHDVVRPDPDECSNGPKGASPFMTSLVVDGMMDYWLLTSDPNVGPFVKKLATWYEKDAVTSDKKAFRYLWNCLDNPYDDSETADLNLLIVHVFGAAYVVTKDKHFLDFGDKIADSGLAAMYTEAPKQWNQAARSFGKYLGYRALGAEP